MFNTAVLNKTSEDGAAYVALLLYNILLEQVEDEWQLWSADDSTGFLGYLLVSHFPTADDVFHHIMRNPSRFYIKEN